MRWKAVGVGISLMLAVVAGCKQQCFLTECDLNSYSTAGLPAKIECDPDAGIVPISGSCPAPANVLSPERPIRYLSLNEAIATALEQGTIGVQSALFSGALNDNLVSFTGQGVAGSDSIRVLALDPAIIANNIEISLAKFDVRWQSSVTWTTTDRPVGTAIDTFQAAQAGRVNAIQLQNASVSTGLIKPLPSGGVAGITFNTDYELSNLNPRVNPSYRPALTFNFEQPLLQGFGVEIEQLRFSHPGSLQTPFQNQGRVEGILITRLRFDQQRTEFERNVAFMLLNVEISYWNLYGAYWALYSNEQALRQAFEALKINKARFEAGRIPIQDYKQTERQYFAFRAQRLTSMGQVLETERQLRGLLNLRVEDGTRLVPSDTPTISPYQPDWDTALNEALALRPELVLRAEDLKFRQLDLINQKNTLLPDVRFLSSYNVNAIGTRLDGPDSNNAFRNLAVNDFNNWSLGLRAEIPLGFREAHAGVRSARLNLRSYAVLKDQENKAERFLTFNYRRLFQFNQEIRDQRSQREAAAAELDARFKEFLAGRGTLDILLEAQRVWAASLQAEYAAVVNYNNALAGFQFAKGTMLQHDNVIISEGPLPNCAQVSAVAHERERSKALELRDRPNGHAHAPVADPLEGVQLPIDTVVPVPSILPGTMPKPEMENLPPPHPKVNGTGAPGELGELSDPGKLGIPNGLPVSLGKP